MAQAILGGNIHQKSVHTSHVKSSSAEFKWYVCLIPKMEGNSNQITKTEKPANHRGKNEVMNI